MSLIVVKIGLEKVLLETDKSYLIKIPRTDNLTFWHRKKCVRIFSNHATICFKEDWTTEPSLKDGDEYIKQDPVKLTEIFDIELRNNHEPGTEIRSILNELKIKIAELEMRLSEQGITHERTC